LFHRFGLPRRIHADQGRPWAGPGPAWLTQLSAWWISLGIRPTFSRRARPGDNAAHEQWHRKLKADTTRPPSANPPAQQRRLQRWQFITALINQKCQRCRESKVSAMS